MLIDKLESKASDDTEAADRARKLAVEAAREADRAEGMEGFVMDRLSPRQPSRNVSTGVTAG